MDREVLDLGVQIQGPLAVLKVYLTIELVSLPSRNQSLGSKLVGMRFT